MRLFSRFQIRSEGPSKRCDIIWADILGFIGIWPMGGSVKTNSPNDKGTNPLGSRMRESRKIHIPRPARDQGGWKMTPSLCIKSRNGAGKIISGRV